MSRVKPIFVISLLVLTAIGFTSLGNPQPPPSGSSQSAQGENPQTMQALLNEVRQLRLAIQRSNLSAYRAQIIIERTRSQQQRVDQLSEKLREMRERIDEMKIPQSESQDRLKKIESQLSEERDANKRRELEELQDEGKTRLKLLAQDEARRREQEAQLASQLQVEQARLAELNDQLDALQHELELPTIESNPQQGGKRP
jgi:hypothetical protein